MMNAQDKKMLMDAKVLMDSYKIYYGIKVTDVREEDGLKVVYIEIPKNARGESHEIANSLKKELNKLLESYGVDTFVYYFKVRYKTV